MTTPLCRALLVALLCSSVLAVRAADAAEAAATTSGVASTAGQPCTLDSDCSESDAITCGPLHICVDHAGGVNPDSGSSDAGSTGSGTDPVTVTTTSGDSLPTDPDGATITGGSTDPFGATDLTIPAGGACVFASTTTGCADPMNFYCNPNSNVCEPFKAQSCVVNGPVVCSSFQLCSPNDNRPGNTQGSCVSVPGGFQPNACNPACASSQVCVVGSCVTINNDGGTTAGELGGACLAGDRCTGTLVCSQAICIPNLGLPIGTGGIQLTGTPCSATEACPSGQVCLDGDCAVTGSLGTPCTDSCQTGLSCVANVCIFSDFHIGGTIGSACSAQATCALGLVCTSGTCQTVAPGSGGVGGTGGGLGSSCTATALCSTGFQCAAGVCIPNVAIGAGSVGTPCDDTHFCNLGLTCTLGVCRAGVTGATGSPSSAGSQLATCQCTCGGAAITDLPVFHPPDCSTCNTACLGAFASVPSATAAHLCTGTVSGACVPGSGSSTEGTGTTSTPPTTSTTTAGSGTTTTTTTAGSGSTTTTTTTTGGSGTINVPLPQNGAASIAPTAAALLLVAVALMARF